MSPYFGEPCDVPPLWPCVAVAPAHWLVLAGCGTAVPGARLPIRVGLLFSTSITTLVH